jgi:hypothetical protein
MLQTDSRRTIVQLRGGLGNQLFQYAAGLAVAERTGAPLLFDTSFIPFEDGRDYALARCGIEVETVHRQLDAKALFDDREAIAEYVRENFDAELYWEERHDFADELGAAPAGSYLVGYWQSERYFPEDRSPLDRLLETLPMDPEDPIAAEIAAASEPVAVHVRRTDYVTNPTIANLLGAKDTAYHYRAAEAVSDAIVEPTWFVFSDDPEWCRAELSLPGSFRLVSGARSAEQDLMLMASCRHASIGNSSFAWWGAWLGEQRGSVVSAPAVWFADRSVADADLVPDRWLTV